MKLTPLLFLLILCACRTTPKDTSTTEVQQTTSDEPWQYVEIDSTKVKWGDFADPDWLRYFGLDAFDLNQDGFLDIITGRNVYLNPGGNMEGQWQKVDLGINADAMIALDVNDNGRADIIAEALPNVYHFEATDKSATKWTHEVVAQIPPTSHSNGQGYRKAQVIPGGKPEVLLSSQEGIYLLELPTKDGEQWKVSLIGENATDEGFAVGDIDGDGDLDVAGGRRAAGKDEPTILVWFSNPNDGTAPWKDEEIGFSEHPIDRVELADFDRDGKLDVAYSEERYPGLEPDAHLYVLLKNNGHATEGWTRKTIVTQYSMNNLDAKDVDKDGDVDLITSEHKGKDLALQLWLNDGNANFSKQEIDRGKEAHLGARAYDMDGDGDLDIVSIGWDRHQFVHLWRNDKTK